MSRRLIVAIDGTAGSGKSTVAREVAARLGLSHVDTGATYRIVAHKALERSIPLDRADKLAALAEETLALCSLANETLAYEGRALGPEIRTPEVSEATSIVSAHPEVRDVAVAYQRRVVPPGGAVVEGRDIGTVVWPQADLKVYLDAAPEVRAARRASDTGRPDSSAVEVHERDRRDASRPVGAMQPAPDAVLVDTSNLTASEVADRIVSLLGPQKPDLLYATARAILSGAIRAVFRLEVMGAENIPARGGAILAPNHRSLLDIPVAGVVTRRHVAFMAKEELFASSIGGGLIRRLGSFPVKRGKPDRGALQKSLEVLDNGGIVGIFPEGTRRPSNRFEELEDGFAYVALKSGAPVVPLAISGTEAVFPPGRKLPRLAKVRVRIGQPFRLGSPQRGMLPRARIREATAEASRLLSQVMDELEPK